MDEGDGKARSPGKFVHIHCPEDKGHKGWSPIPNAMLAKIRLLGPTACFVYLALLYFAGRDRVAWPSVATLERHTGLTRRGVQLALRKLEQSGWIVREPSAHASNQWRVTEPSGWVRT